MKALQIVRALVAVAALSALSFGASAQALTGGVDVKVTLTSKCRLQTVAANPVIDFGTYIAFQAGPVTPAGVPVKFECTRGYGASPTAAWDTTNGDAAGVGVLAGLEYQLTASGGVRVAGAAATATTGAGADVVTYTVTGSMAANQPGQNSAGVQSHTRTLMVTF